MLLNIYVPDPTIEIKWLYVTICVCRCAYARAIAEDNLFKLQLFWSQVHKKLQFIVVPLVMLLGDFRGCEFSKTLLFNMIAAATMVISRKWKSLELPSVGEWLSKVRYIVTALMNKLSAICAYRIGDEKALYKFNKQ